MGSDLPQHLYNSRILNTYVNLLQNRYPHVDINSVLEQSGIEEYELSDQGHWHTDAQVNRFYELIVNATGNENLAREAGRHAAAPGVLGMMRQYTLGLVGPANAFSIIGKMANNFTRSSVFHSKKLGPNKVEVRVEQVAGVQEESFVCENRKGFLEAIVTIFDLPLPRIDHPECLFDDGECCRYIVSWEPSMTANLKRLRNWSIPLAIFAGGMISWLSPAILPLYAISATIGILLFYLVVEQTRNMELSNGLQNLRNTSDQLAEQIAVNYRNTQLTQSVGAVISGKNTIEDVVRSVIELLQKQMDFDRGMILLANEDRTRLDICGAYGYIDQHLDLLSNISFSLENTSSRGMFVVAFRDQKPFLINDVNKITQDLSQKSQDFVRGLGCQSFICVPIVCEGESIGILAVDNLTTKKPLLISDMNMISGVAPVIGVSIHNARLAEEQKGQFEATLRIMADSIDARDFLTAGHSEKVADFAEGIARELGLDDEFVEIIRISALLHDYGKIAVPDAILKKTDLLSDDERAIIRTHPTRTREILEQVPFKGAYAQIPAIAAAHHECWNGNGYPLGLCGEEIPLGARIIAVADFFEAITALRHYRAPMPIADALQVLLSESGKRFEPSIVEALGRHLRKTQVCLLEQRPDQLDFRKERLGPRLPYRTQTSVAVAKRVISGASVDLSPQGIFIRTTELDALQPGIEVTVTFTIPGPEELVTLPATVAWLNQGSPPRCKRLPQGFGVFFGEQNKMVSSRINDFIAQAYTGKATQIILPGENPLEQGTVH